MLCLGQRWSHVLCISETAENTASYSQVGKLLVFGVRANCSIIASCSLRQYQLVDILKDELPVNMAFLSSAGRRHPSPASTSWFFLWSSYSSYQTSALEGKQQLAQTRASASVWCATCLPCCKPLLGFELICFCAQTDRNRRRTEARMDVKWKRTTTRVVKKFPGDVAAFLWQIHTSR